MGGRLWRADQCGRTSDWKGVRLTEVRFSRRMTHATQFFDFVLILVTVGALGIMLTLLLHITLQSLRSRN